MTSRSEWSSSDSSRSRPMPVRASRQRVMYSARAGIVNRTVAAPELLLVVIEWPARKKPCPERCKINLSKLVESSLATSFRRVYARATPGLTRRQPTLRKRHGHLLALAPGFQDREHRHVLGAQREGDEPHDVVGAVDGLPVDRQDHVAP